MIASKLAKFIGRLTTDFVGSDLAEADGANLSHAKVIDHSILGKMQQLITQSYSHSLSKVVLEIPVFTSGLLPIELFAELSWLDLRIVQVPMTTKYFYNVDGQGDREGRKGRWGSNPPLDPHGLTIHDQGHVVILQSQAFTSLLGGALENEAHRKLAAYVQALENHPRWIPLLAFFIFYVRQEEGEQLNFMNLYLDRRYDEDKIRLRIDNPNDFGHDLKLQELFHSDWPAFIAFLKTVQV